MSSKLINRPESDPYFSFHYTARSPYLVSLCHDFIHVIVQGLITKQVHHQRAIRPATERTKAVSQNSQVEITNWQSSEKGLHGKYLF
jgi:hypothetical protein